MILQKIKLFLFTAIVILVLSYFIKQPYLEYCGVSKGSVQEIGAARYIAAGKGLLLTIKHTYEIPSAPPVPLAAELGLLYPVLLSFYIDRIHQMQWVNIAISIVNLLMLFYAVRKVFGDFSAWLSLLTFMFLPFLSISASYLWNLSLLLFWLILAFLIYVSFDKPWAKILSGVFIGICFWTEPWAFFFFPAMLPGFFICNKPIRENVKSAMWTALGWICAVIPLNIWIFSITGSLLHPRLTSHFRVVDYPDFYFKSYQYQNFGFGRYVLGGLNRVIPEIINNFVTLTGQTGEFYIGWLLLFAIVITIVFRKTVFIDFPEKYCPFISFSLLCFIFNGLLWSNRNFYVTVVYILLFTIPISYYLLGKISFKDFDAGKALGVIILCLFLNQALEHNHNEMVRTIRGQNFHSVYFRGEEQTEWIEANTLPEDTIAAFYPWGIHLKTRRPAGILSYNLEPESLREFAKKIRYNYYVNNDDSAVGNRFLHLIDRNELPWLIPVGENVWKVDYDILDSQDIRR